MKILVVSSCTKAKLYTPENRLSQNDFKLKVPDFQKRCRELDQFRRTAIELYTGSQHKILINALKKIWSTFGKSSIDLFIISAGFGLISADHLIVPYDATFQNLPKSEILKISDRLLIHDQIETLVNDYDLVFFLLGKEYVISLRLPLKISKKTTLIFFLGKIYRSMITENSQTFFVSAGRKEAKLLKSATISLKGKMFAKICELVIENGWTVFDQIKNDPNFIDENVIFERDQQMEIFDEF